MKLSDKHLALPTQPVSCYAVCKCATDNQKDFLLASKIIKRIINMDDLGVNSASVDRAIERWSKLEVPCLEGRSVRKSATPTAKRYRIPLNQTFLKPRMISLHLSYKELLMLGGIATNIVSSSTKRNSSKIFRIGHATRRQNCWSTRITIWPLRYSIPKDTAHL